MVESIVVAAGAASAAVWRTQTVARRRKKVHTVMVVVVVVLLVVPRRVHGWLRRNKHPKQKRRKTRMVYNYKRLNDNTHIDGYTIPSKDLLINRIQKAKWFSKFDLKSGFHQVKMHPDSIKWIPFSCSEGLFEWKVISFGLKNAPQIFQWKMDNIFGNYKEFTFTYIDDVLIFSKTK